VEFKLYSVESMLQLDEWRLSGTIATRTARREVRTLVKHLNKLLQHTTAISKVYNTIHLLPDGQQRDYLSRASQRARGATKNRGPGPRRIALRSRAAVSLRCSGVCRHADTAAGFLLRMRLWRLYAKARCEAPDAALELAVLGGVDERVDAAVGEHQHHGEVVEPVDRVRIHNRVSKDEGTKDGRNKKGRKSQFE